MFILDDRHRTIKSEESNKNPKQTNESRKKTTKKQKTKKKTPKIEFIIIIMKAAYCKSNA